MVTLVSKKKMLLITDEYPPALGGAGTVAATMFHILSSYYDITLVSGSGFNEDVNWYINKRRFVWPLQYWWRLKTININAYDVIILNDGPVQYAANFFLPSLIKPNVYSFIHGVEKLLIKPSFYSKIVNYRYFLEKTYRRSRHVLTVSNYLSQRSAELFPFLDKEKLSVVYNPLTFLIDEPVKNSFKLLSVSRLEEGKGYRRMLRIFQVLKNRDSRWTWSIVGDGSYAEDFKRLCVESGLNDDIKFHGAVDNKKLIGIYRAHSVFILLSELEESFGLTYLEAVCCGIPSISYDRHGPSEIASLVSGCVAIDPELSDEDIAELVLQTDRFKDNLSKGLDIFSLENYTKVILGVLNSA